MILRRITKHVTNQNWFAVFIDFIIVVFGVYMGLQVQQWSQNMSSRAEEVRVLRTMTADINADIIAINSALDRIYIENDSRKRVIQYTQGIEGAMPEEDFHHHIKMGVWQFTTFKPAQTTLDELKSSAKINQIGSPKLRNKIQEYYNILGDHVTDTENLKHIVLTFVDPFLVENHDMSLMFERSTDKEIVELNKLYRDTEPVINHEAMKSQKFRNIVLQVAVASIDATQGINRILKVYQEMLVLIEERLDELGTSQKPTIKEIN
ncbi:MAG: hypothetical protein AB8B80_10305 [Marinicellaceae bacterium]